MKRWSELTQREKDKLSTKKIERIFQLEKRAWSMERKAAAPRHRSEFYSTDIYRQIITQSRRAKLREQIASDLFAVDIEALPLSTRALNCLANIGIRTTGQLIERSIQDLLRCRHLGKKTLAEIQAILRQLGLPPIKGARLGWYQ